MDGAESGVTAPDEGVDDGALVGEKLNVVLLFGFMGELSDTKRRNSA